MTTRRYTQLDVFGSRPGAGNPLAVVHDAADLDDAAMQAFAAWKDGTGDALSDKDRSPRLWAQAVMRF